MNEIYRQCPGSEPAARSISAHALLREQPVEEYEDEEDDEQDGQGEYGDGDEGYSE